MAKALCIAGMVVAALQVLVFGVDISVHFPFNAPSWWMDVFPIVCALILGYLSWATLREQT